MNTAKIFQSGNSQALRIPKECQTDQKEIIMKKIGSAYLLLPVDDPWAGLKASMGRIPDDFMEDREQPNTQDLREEF